MNINVIDVQIAEYEAFFLSDLDIENLKKLKENDFCKYIDKTDKNENVLFFEYYSYLYEIIKENKIQLRPEAYQIYNIIKNKINKVYSVYLIYKHGLRRSIYLTKDYKEALAKQKNILKIKGLDKGQIPLL